MHLWDGRLLDKLTKVTKKEKGLPLLTIFDSSLESPLIFGVA